MANSYSRGDWQLKMPVAVGPQEQPLGGAEVGRSPPQAVDNQELVFEEEVFGDYRLGPARSKQRRQRGQQMREQRE
jgi:hypothetical protein